MFRPKSRTISRCSCHDPYYAGLSLGEIDWEPTCNPFEAGSDDFKDYNAGYCDALEQVFERADS
jgi:hypothetical protein